MANLIQLLVSGVSIGAIYALIALGLLTIYRASQVVNFAQGEFVMLGGMMSYWFWNSLHLPYWLAAVVTVVVVAAVGLVMYQLVIAPLRNASLAMVILATLGVSSLIQAIALLWWDAWPVYGPAFSGEAPVSVGSVGLRTQDLWIIGMAVVVVTALWFLNNHTHLGKTMTAAATEPLAAGFVGIRAGALIRLAFVISASIGAIAGIFMSPVIPFTFNVGGVLVIKGFVAAVLGGWGTASGAMVGGIALGVIETLVGGYLPSGFQDAIAFVILILVLTLLPGGLLRQKLITAS